MIPKEALDEFYRYVQVYGTFTHEQYKELTRMGRDFDVPFESCAWTLVDSYRCGFDGHWKLIALAKTNETFFDCDFLFEDSKTENDRKRIINDIKDNAFANDIFLLDSFQLSDDGLLVKIRSPKSLKEIEDLLYNTASCSPFYR